ncbi:LOW QUALITY PROTEIN: reverse transcriptase [Phytophthora megakarya]|uniref:Reverse transcriptase n=1 Tax=Phytophthora megakarya TaxID=4795 RepID=A0A225USA6_9STRA|nr:LOW QUALITY PROTEIN: reverse transcriptase [Phytophthora megakarya]
MMSSTLWVLLVHETIVGVLSGADENGSHQVYNVPSTERIIRDMMLPMGVSNAPATMHRQTSSLFKGLPHTRSFYDDIYIFTKSKVLNEHLQDLRNVLEILKKKNLYVKLAKCVFCAEEIPCLGDFIGQNETIANDSGLAHPADTGTAPQLSRFKRQYAALTALLFTVLKKKNQRNLKITLNGLQLKNIKEMKHRLADTPVLRLPDFTQQMHLRTDASQFTAGGVPFQVVNGIERPIEYKTRKLKSAEMKYPTQQQELLAIVKPLAAFRIYCLDQPVMIETDHKSLEGVFQQKMTSRRLARWCDILAEYQPVFAYLPGAQIGIADDLISSHRQRNSTTCFFNGIMYQLRIAEIKLTNDLVKVSSRVRRTIKKRNTLSANQGVSEKQYKPYFEEKNMVWYQGSTDANSRIVVPNIVTLKHRIIAEVHYSNYDGHPSADRSI